MRIRQNKKSINTIGIIPTDSLYSPIEKVSYTAEPTRVGQSAKYDQLVLEIQTDGSIQPHEALALAAKILVEHLNLFVELNDYLPGFSFTISNSGTEYTSTVSKKYFDIEIHDSNAIIITFTTPDGFTINPTEYIVNENMSIAYAEDQDSQGGTVDPTDVPEELKKYILGIDEKGRDVFEIMDSEDTYTFLQDPENSNSTIHEKIKFSGINYNEEIEDVIFVIRYNRDVYGFRIIGIDDTSSEYYGQTRTLKGSLEKISTAEGNLGKYVEYAGNTWIVLRDNTSGVELISANATEKELTLGGSFDSYNNAVTTLVNECKNVCKEEYGIEIGENVIGIRSVGGPEIDETEDTDIIDFNALPVFDTTQGAFQSASYNAQNIKIGDDKYLADYNQMKKIGILLTDNYQYDYWLASRFMKEYSYDVYLGLRYVDEEWSVSDDNLCSVHTFEIINKYRHHDFYSDSKTVRPVVTLTPGILKNATATGTIDDPIILN